jgi:hypothetical protein
VEDAPTKDLLTSKFFTPDEVRCRRLLAVQRGSHHCVTSEAALTAFAAVTSAQVSRQQHAQAGERRHLQPPAATCGLQAITRSSHIVLLWPHGLHNALCITQREVPCSQPCCRRVLEKHAPVSIIRLLMAASS